MSVDRWEHGSELHGFPYPPGAGEESPWDGDGQLMGSGRDALRSVLTHGQERRGWRRLWIPGYFCQEVASALGEILPLAVYDDSPTCVEPNLQMVQMQMGDVFLWVNFFGMRPDGFTGSLPNGIEIIEDYTHDPWSPGAWRSTADWCVASLRKTLPIPDGGVLWSPKGHELPAPMPVSDQRYLASLEKLAGMWLKNLYLEGHDVEKDSFRSITLSGERQIAAGDASAMPAWTRELLKTFPVHQWRAQRQENFAHLCNGLTELSGVSALRPVTAVDGNAWPPKQQGAAFTAVLVCDSPAQREMLRRALIVRRVYPAVLWPLEDPAAPGISNAALHLSRCTLSLHCDMRYTLDDMDKLGEIVRECATDMVN